jgi:hypothetical protein
MRDPEEMEVQWRLHLSMRSKILLLSTPFILTTLFLSMTAGPFLMDMIVGLETDEDKMPEDNSSEPDEFFLTILKDDFDTINPHWNEYMAGTGTSSFSNGTLYLIINEEGSAESFSHAALHDYSGSFHLYSHRDTTVMPWLYKTMEVRLRCSNDNKRNSSIGGGKWWWGFVDFIGERPPFRKNALYFKSGSPECEEGDIGFTVESLVNGTVVFQKHLTGIDMRDWHNYTVIWNADNATFKVDGEVVATISGAGKVPYEPMPMYIAISNIISHSPWAWMGLDHDQFIEIDFLHLYYADEEEYRNETELLSGLFANASRLIQDLESRGYDVQEQRYLYSMAENNWTNYRLYLARQSLEEIISSAWKYEVGDEIIRGDLFRIAEEEIARVEGEGIDVRFLKADLSRAEKCWETQDFACAKMYLERIINSIAKRS